MTLRLILTRHAKSSWSDPIIDDHDRPLNNRGRAAARAIGGWLAARGHVPDAALVSSAARTRETWEHVAEAFDAAPSPSIRPDLYQAEPAAMLATLREATGKLVMLVAHNPGTAYFAQGIVETPPPDARFARYPTGATTVIDFDADDWGRVDWRSGRIVDLVFPRDLT
ncbi:histidine phosphatase family protein [Maritimibacter sp. HL-12]|uniref:SixA phosphatase family protein n=1 Tax=Maritimibacter sp. HL-12 TaxID=1162418 RepID=UPI000A0F3F56|nr:histidine phosphatase family protein [Maritimibacter sp. HL-12]SMH49694.1 phosphohistidine phosphatase [Maritimibacter sp. HL-12]